ncbi:MAG TPA: AAA family ATPase, partial [Candidatus Binatia bacterium]|nr:AAA family ATPase [Candidatus Binatia bacterium]
LTTLWRDAVAGRSGGVLLLGEPGIGKSRLLRELRRQVPKGAWLEFRCTPEGEAAPLRPVVECLASLDTPLPALLERLDLSSGTELAALTALMDPASAGPAGVTRERRKELTLQALVRLVEGLGREQPIVVAFEDVHWADPTTMELVAELAASFARPTLGAGSARGCLVLSARLEFAAPVELPGVAPLPLMPLRPAEVEELAQACIADPQRRTPELLEALVREADGVPLFVEEVARVLSDPRESADIERHAPVPSGLWNLLASRLDRLSASARETAQTAAVVGREFDAELLRAVSTSNHVTMSDDLTELVRAGIVHRRRSSQGERFAFKHALLRDAAYESSMRSERQRTHARVARVLQGRFPEVERARPELLAWHLERAGDAIGAIGYRRRAGDLAMRRGTYLEAIAQYRAASQAVARVPERGQRLQLELAVTEALGTALFTTQGYAAAEVNQAFSRAQTLCDEIGSEVPLRVLYGLWGVRLARSDPAATAALLDRLRALAERSKDPTARVVTHSCAGTRAFLAGRFGEAVEEMRACLEWRDSAAYKAFVEEYGYDLSTYAYGYLAGALWYLGRFAEARRVTDEMLDAAERSRNPYSLTVALAFGANMGEKMRDVDRADALSARGVAIATEQKLYFWLGPLLSLRGWVSVRRGDVDPGIQLIEQGLGVFASAGVRATYRCYVAYLVEGFLAKGALDEGLAAVERRLEPERPALDVFAEPDLVRLKGELLLARGEREAARAALRAGLETSRAWGARCFELRLATSLARLLAAEGDGAGARGLLEPVVAGYAGEPDVPDVEAARRVLQTCAVA